MGIEKISETLVKALIITLVVLSQSFAGADVVSKTIDTVQLHSMIVDNAYEIEGGRKKQFTVIDARTEKEYDKDHIFSAINIPEKDFEKSINLLPQDKSVLLVVYGNDTKGEESCRWAGKAAAAGYLNILIYADGFQVWKKNKMPVAPLNNGI
jgi:rhodanese-related sulfurtransferase